MSFKIACFISSSLLLIGSFASTPSYIGFSTSSSLETLSLFFSSFTITISSGALSGASLFRVLFATGLFILAGNFLELSLITINSSFLTFTFLGFAASITLESILYKATIASSAETLEELFLSNSAISFKTSAFACFNVAFCSLVLSFEGILIISVRPFLVRTSSNNFLLDNVLVISLYSLTDNPKAVAFIISFFIVVLFLFKEDKFFLNTSISLLICLALSFSTILAALYSSFNLSNSSSVSISASSFFLLYSVIILFSFSYDCSYFSKSSFKILSASFIFFSISNSSLEKSSSTVSTFSSKLESFSDILEINSSLSVSLLIELNCSFNSLISDNSDFKLVLKSSSFSKVFASCFSSITSSFGSSVDSTFSLDTL